MATPSSCSAGAVGTTSAVRVEGAGVRGEEEDGMDKVLSDDHTKVMVTFVYDPDDHTEEVYVAGEFNAWSPEVDRLERDTAGRFSLTKQLEIGWHYRYRYVADGRWITDPN